MKRRELKLYCFSPPVMLATFFIETALAIYTVCKYKLNEVGKLVVILLLLLATFQLAEYNVCAIGWIDSITASRIGYVAITLLLPVGIQLAYALAGAKKHLLQRPLQWLAYITGFAFVGFFLVVGNSLTGHACLGNYVIFEMAPGSEVLYGYYYGVWLLGGIALTAYLARSAQKAIKQALYGLTVGYVIFVGLTMAANLVDPHTIAGAPSIMCGFAVILAFILAFWVLPKAGLKK